jgi:hypothetical protein
MRSRWSVVAAPFFAFSLGACSDGIGPGNEDLVDLALDFCAGEAPIFFAIQNEGDSWRRVNGNAGGTFSFQATEKVGVAMTFSFGNDVFTDVYYATAEELEPLSGIACTEVVGAKTLNGSVTGLGANDQVVVSMSGDELAFVPPPNTFQMIGIPDGPQDLIAHRDVAGISGDIPTSVIVRRALNLTHNTTITPTLDFNAGSAVATHTGTIVGLNASDNNYYDISFRTASGTDHTLFLSPFITSGSQTLYGIPALLTQSGDMHRIDLSADAADNSSYRSLRHFYRNAGDMTFTLGGVLNQPSITTAGTSPYVRLRATLASQTEYGSFASAFFGQGATTTRSFFVTETSGYRDGIPATWNLEIPDLTPAGSFPVTAQLQAGQSTVWFVEAYNGTLANFIGASPAEGSTILFAGRTSDVSTIQMSRTRGARPEPRSPLSDRALRRAR